MHLFHIRIIGDAICIVICLLAAVSDVRSRRIPDALTLPALICGLVMAAAWGGYSLAGAVTAVALLSGLFAMFAASGGMGWGDVKLMAAVGALLGWPLGAWSVVLYALFFTTLIGGALGLVMAARGGRLGATFRGILNPLRHRSKGIGPEGSGISIPYGVAICLGTTWAVAGRYLPELLVV